MKKVIIATALSVVASAHLFAADSVEGAFAAGKTTGDISLYTLSTNNSGSTADTGYTTGSVAIKYSTDSYLGLKANMGVRATGLFNEKTSGDYNDANKEIVNIANLEYTRGVGTLIVGRQPVDLEWISDYHNAAVAILDLKPLTLVAGYTESKAVAKPDLVLGKFAKFNGNKGAYTLDATYDIAANAKVNAYYMDAPDLFSAVGGKIGGSIAGVDAFVKYATTKEDVAGTADGKIYNAQLGYTLAGVNLAAGYVKTDKTGGAGSLPAIGDNICPLDLGSSIYSLVYTYNAKTTYGKISTDVAGFTLGAVYASIKHDDYTSPNETIYVKGTDKELDLTVQKDIAKNLSAKVLYTNISAEVAANDQSYISALLTYKF
jgi:hypothetical protein